MDTDKIEPESPPAWMPPLLPSRDNQRKIATFARRKAEPPKAAIFKQLLDLWIARFANPGETRVSTGGALKRLADWLDVFPQNISAWRDSQEHDGRRRNGAPWWVCLAMAGYLDIAIVLTDDGDGFMLIKKPKTGAKKR